MQQLNNAKSLEILLVEDNPGDVDLVKASLRKCFLKTQLTVGRDGAEAIAILQERLKSPPLPDIILLDLNLPKKKGGDVLREIKSHPDLSRIPVIVLTSSSSEDEVLNAYKLGASCYLTKSVDLNEQRQVMKSFEDFWFRFVHLPDSQ